MSNNSNKEWQGIPRKKIDWYPTIDYGKCSNCLSCISFCKNGVYKNNDGKPKVVKPYNCVVGCIGCDNICPSRAISHPPQEYLVKLANKFKKNINGNYSCSCGCK